MALWSGGSGSGSGRAHPDDSSGGSVGGAMAGSVGNTSGGSMTGFLGDISGGSGRDSVRVAPMATPRVAPWVALLLTLLRGTCVSVLISTRLAGSKVGSSGALALDQDSMAVQIGWLFRCMGDFLGGAGGRSCPGIACCAIDEQLRNVGGPGPACLRAADRWNQPDGPAPPARPGSEPADV